MDGWMDATLSASLESCGRVLTAVSLHVVYRPIVLGRGQVRTFTTLHCASAVAAANHLIIESGCVTFCDNVFRSRPCSGTCFSSQIMNGFAFSMLQVEGHKCMRLGCS
jgi:hypothetical protein